MVTSPLLQASHAFSDCLIEVVLSTVSAVRPDRQAQESLLDGRSCVLYRTYDVAALFDQSEREDGHKWSEGRNGSFYLHSQSFCFVTSYPPQNS